MKPTRLPLDSAHDYESEPDGDTRTGEPHWNSLVRETPRYVDARLERCDPRFADWVKLVQAEDSPPNLVVVGPPGVGKTYGMYGMARELLFAGFVVAFTGARDLVNRVRDGRSQIEALSKAQVLLLDDVGTEPDIKWSREILDELADNRWRTQLPTVISTNLKVEELPQWLEPRTCDRFLGGAEFITLTGVSRRDGLA